MKIVDRLENIRKSKTLNWGELCELLGIKRSMLHYLREGDRRPSSKLLRKIAEIEQQCGIEVVEDTRAGHMTGPKKQGEIAQNTSAGKNLPTLGTQPPATVQSLDTRLAAVELKLDEMLKLLKGMKR